MLNHPLSEYPTMSRHAIRVLSSAVFPFPRKMVRGRRWEPSAATAKAAVTSCLSCQVNVRDTDLTPMLSTVLELVAYQFRPSSVGCQDIQGSTSSGRSGNLSDEESAQLAV